MSIEAVGRFAVENFWYLLGAATVVATLIGLIEHAGNEESPPALRLAGDRVVAAAKGVGGLAAAAVYVGGVALFIWLAVSTVRWLWSNPLF